MTVLTNANTNRDCPEETFVRTAFVSPDGVWWIMDFNSVKYLVNHQQNWKSCERTDIIQKSGRFLRGSNRVLTYIHGHVTHVIRLRCERTEAPSSYYHVTPNISRTHSVLTVWYNEMVK